MQTPYNDALLSHRVKRIPAATKGAGRILVVCAPRERIIAILLASGATKHGVARELGVTRGRVQGAVRRIGAKLRRPYQEYFGFAIRMSEE